MVTVPEPAVRFGVVVAAAILWVAKGYALSVYRGEKEFKLAFASKTLAIGLVGGVIAFALGNGTGGEALAMAMTFAVPLVDNLWNRFSSTWNKLEDLDTVERFEAAANDLLDEYGDDAAEKMDETRLKVTNRGPTDPMPTTTGMDGAVASAGESVDGLGGSVGEQQTDDAAGDGFEFSDEDAPPAGAVSGGTSDESTPTPAERVESKVEDVPDSRAGWLKLRAVAALIDGVDGNQSRADLRERFLRYGTDFEAVLDAFATVEARERGEERALAAEGGESA